MRKNIYFLCLIILFSKLENHIQEVSGEAAKMNLEENLTPLLDLFLFRCVFFHITPIKIKIRILCFLNIKKINKNYKNKPVLSHNLFCFIYDINFLI